MSVTVPSGAERRQVLVEVLDRLIAVPSWSSYVYRKVAPMMPSRISPSAIGYSKPSVCQVNSVPVLVVQSVMSPVSAVHVMRRVEAGKVTVTVMVSGVTVADQPAEAAGRATVAVTVDGAVLLPAERVGE